MVSSPDIRASLFRAMASGVLLLALNEGIDGIIQNGENGFLCEPRNVDDLANTIDKIANLSRNETFINKCFRDNQRMT